MHHSYMYATCVLRAAEEKSPPHLSLSDCTSVTLPPIVHAHTRAPLMHVWNAHVQMHPARSKQLTLSFCSDHIVHEHSFTPLRLVSAFVSSFCTHACTHAPHHTTRTCVCATRSPSLFDSLSFCLILDEAKQTVSYFRMCDCLSYCYRIGHSVKPSLCSICVSVCCCRA